VADDEKVGDVAQSAEIQDDQLFRLFVQGALDAAGDLGG